MSSNRSKHAPELFFSHSVILSGVKNHAVFRHSNAISEKVWPHYELLLKGGAKDKGARVLTPDKITP